MLISCAVTAQLICAFVFTYAHCWLSYTVAHILTTCNKFGSERENKINDFFFNSTVFGIFTVFIAIAPDESIFLCSLFPSEKH